MSGLLIYFFSSKGSDAYAQSFTEGLGKEIKHVFLRGNDASGAAVNAAPDAEKASRIDKDHSTR